MPETPAWAKAFNDRKLADARAGESWMPFTGPALRQMPSERGGPLYEAIYASPFGNELLLEFASELLRA